MLFVFAISSHELPLIEYCHFKIEPVSPLSVRVLLVFPEQILLPPVTVPPIELGFTVTVVEPEYAGHIPI